MVVLTSSAAEQDIAKAYAHNANSYLVKPVDFEKFTRMMKDLGYYWLAWNTNPLQPGAHRKLMVMSKPLLILIVEDEDDHYRLIERALTGTSQFQLERASSIQEARAKMHKGSPNSLSLIGSFLTATASI